MILLMYYLIIALVVCADQILKKIVSANMTLYESIPVIGDFFNITYIQNRGAAFSILEGWKPVLILIPLVFVIAVLIIIYKKSKTAHSCFLWAMSLVAAGGLGNLIDRTASGYVIDYLDFGNFPVFNLADISVCVGCGLLVIYVLFIDGKNERKKRADHNNS